MSEHRIGGLAVTVDGSGPPLLFLHGIGSARQSFVAQREHFRSRFTCVCPDAPGYGDSDDAESIDGMDGYAETFEHLLDSFGPASIVGLSFGGVVAARMAMRRRVEIISLVLGDTSRGSGVEPAKAAAMRARPDELARIGAEAFATARASRLVSDAAPPSLIDHVAATMASAIRLPGYAQAAEAMASTDHTERLGDITCPTLVLVGEHDVVCPPSEAELITASIPGAEFDVVVGAGHLSYQEAPGRFNQITDRFLHEHHPRLSTSTSTSTFTSSDTSVSERIGARP